jgi:hypothetical protein
MPRYIPQLKIRWQKLLIITSLYITKRRNYREKLYNAEKSDKVDFEKICIHCKRKDGC